MNKSLFSILVLWLLQIPTFATWSVVAVDGDTGEVAIASATCLPQSIFARLQATGLKDVQAIIIPGVGVAAAQAQVDVTRKMQNLIAEEMKKGTEPSVILEKLKAADPLHAKRQYGIVDLQGRTAGYSGDGNFPVSLDRQGQVEGTQICYSIQGNILADNEVIEDAVRAFKNTNGTLTDRVMAAMEAADRKGGDARCNCETPPNPPAPCEGKTAHVAYIVVAKKTDKSGSSLNDGQYSLEINVTDENIQPDENDNPVKTLRIRYDRWRGGDLRWQQ